VFYPIASLASTTDNRRLIRSRVNKDRTVLARRCMSVRGQRTSVRYEHRKRSSWTQRERLTLHRLQCSIPFVSVTQPRLQSKHCQPDGVVASTRASSRPRRRSMSSSCSAIFRRYRSSC